jgi:hypothetical protein
MAFMVEKDEAFDPVNVSFFGAAGVVLEAKDVANLIEQFRRVRHGRFLVRVNRVEVEKARFRKFVRVNRGIIVKKGYEANGRGIVKRVIFSYTGNMRTRLTLWPGQKGTRKLVSKYGERLVCVRYRYDAGRRRRYKTVELIEEETVWLPDPAEVVQVRVEWGEAELARQVKQAGGVWKSRAKVWELALGEVIALGLEGRIVGADKSI